MAWSGHLPSQRTPLLPAENHHRRRWPLWLADVSIFPPNLGLFHTLRFPLPFPFPFPLYICNFVRRMGSRKTLNNYREKEEGEKQTNQSFTAFSYYRPFPQSSSKLVVKYLDTPNVSAGFGLVGWTQQASKVFVKLPPLLARVVATRCLHFTASCTTGWVNYANEPSQAALERSSQDAMTSLVDDVARLIESFKNRILIYLFIYFYPW